MREVPMKDLKRNLASVVAAAASGVTVLITRHRRVIARLVPPGLEHVHVGSRAGKGRLRPLLRNATKGRYLEVLADDRRGGDVPGGGA